MVIVAAVDRSEWGRHVVEEARSLADAFGDNLHVVHVLGQSEFVELERASVEKTKQAVEMDQVEQVAANIAAESADAVGGTSDAATVGLIGNAADEIVRYSDEHDARYVVLGGRRRSPVHKAIFGSVTQSVLLNAERPVLTIISEEEDD
jgi:nucleotide-binding universal stress UspA family protein